MKQCIKSGKLNGIKPVVIIHSNNTDDLKLLDGKSDKIDFKVKKVH